MNVNTFSVVPEFLHTVLIYFHSFFSILFHSNDFNHSFSSLILSSASVIMLLIPSSVFFISVTVLFIPVCLFFKFSSSF